MSISETVQVIIVVAVALLFIDIIGDIVGDLYIKKGELALS